MSGATEKTVAEELREAAARLRGTGHHGGITGDCDNPERLALIVALLDAREPLASWLESWDGVELREDGPLPSDFEYALRIARVLNGTTS